jgi:hypothetical protein
MKFEREKDIAVFQGKNWREKWALHRKAEARDPWIGRLKLLIYFFVFAPVVVSSCIFADRLFPHNQALTMMTSIIVAGWPIDMIFFGFLIVPRIRKALDTDAQSAD